MNTRELRSFIEERDAECGYGLCLIASDRRTLSRYEGLDRFGCDLFYPATHDASNGLVVSPASDANFSDFSDIVFLDAPSDFALSGLTGKRVYYNPDICGYAPFLRVDVSRETLLSVYAAVRRSAPTLFGNDPLELLSSCDGLGFDALEFLFATTVFEELGLIAFEGGFFNLCQGVKADLTNSVVYRKVRALREREEVVR